VPQRVAGQGEPPQPGQVGRPDQGPDACRPDAVVPQVKLFQTAEVRAGGDGLRGGIVEVIAVQRQLPQPGQMGRREQGLQVLPGWARLADVQVPQRMTATSRSAPLRKSWIRQDTFFTKPRWNSG